MLLKYCVFKHRDLAIKQQFANNLLKKYQWLNISIRIIQKRLEQVLVLLKISREIEIFGIAN
jgi:hypothetical protein